MAFPESNTDYQGSLSSPFLTGEIVGPKPGLLPIGCGDVIKVKPFLLMHFSMVFLLQPHPVFTKVSCLQIFASCYFCEETEVRNHLFLHFADIILLFAFSLRLVWFVCMCVCQKCFLTLRTKNKSVLISIFFMYVVNKHEIDFFVCSVRKRSKVILKNTSQFTEMTTIISQVSNCDINLGFLFCFSAPFS